MMLDQRDQAAADPIQMITGERVSLGPFTSDLVPHYQRWMNDFRMLRTLRGTGPVPMTAESARQTVEQIASQPDAAPFVIYERDGMRPVGTTVIVDIDYRNRTGRYGIEIGEPTARGKGIGTETSILMLDYAFTVLGLSNVLLTVSELNIGGRRAYERAGYREFGRRRKSRWAAGDFCDDIYMECLATDFISPVLRAIYAPEPASRPTAEAGALGASSPDVSPA